MNQLMRLDFFANTAAVAECFSKAGFLQLEMLLIPDRFSTLVLKVEIVRCSIGW